MPQVSDSGELNKNSHIALIHVAFPLAGQGRHSRTVISELNTAPMHTLTNASPRHHWSSTHSLGSEWIATPYSVKDLALKSLTSYFMPVLTGAFWTLYIKITKGYTWQHGIIKIYFRIDKKITS